MFEACPQNVHAYDIPQRAINLPSYHDMTDADLERVTGALRRLIEEAPHGR
jgi:perosamine synthetase